MANKFIKSIIAGIIATAVMTFVMFVARMMGIPKINPPAMLADITGMPIIIGWFLHFLIGIVFAGYYVFHFEQRISIKNKRL